MFVVQALAHGQWLIRVETPGGSLTLCEQALTKAQLMRAIALADERVRNGARVVVLRDVDVMEKSA